MKQKAIYALLAGILLLSACGGNDTEAMPTVDPVLVQTQAVETFSAALTQTALAAPTQTPFSTPATLPTFAPVTTTVVNTLPAPAQPTIPPTVSCYQLRYISDVSIPDNTKMAPGQTFTKTWKVKNIGSCAWDAGFKFAFTGGEAMTGATYTLPSSVASNVEIEISIAMTAPTNKTGNLRGNWRMSTTGGQYFGDEVYVLIVVGGPTLTPTKTSTPTATATNTATATSAAPTSYP